MNQKCNILEEIAESFPEKFDKIISGELREFDAHLKTCKHCALFMKNRKSVDAAFNKLSRAGENVDIDVKARVGMITCDYFANKNEKTGTKNRSSSFFERIFGDGNLKFALCSSLAVFLLIFMHATGRLSILESYINGIVFKRGQEIAGIEQISGNIEIRQNGITKLLTSSSIAFQPVKLLDNCQLSTREKSSCTISSKAGTYTIGENTSICLNPDDLFIEAGKADFSFGKSGPAGKPYFSINTPHVTIGITGTRLSVEVKDKRSSVTVFEGLVTVSYAKDRPALYLDKDQSLDVNSGEVILTDREHKKTLIK